MKQFYVYILLCNDSSYYTGISNNLEERLYQHNSGFDRHCYTFSRRPVKLVFCESFTNPEEAISAEKRIKRWSRRKKDALIQKDWTALKNLAKCRNETSHRKFESTSGSKQIEHGNNSSSEVDDV